MGKVFTADKFIVPGKASTDFLRGDGTASPLTKLSEFPNTRNDGANPTNKVLGTDASGNLKSYSIATAPAPFLNEVIPDSYLPNNTGNFTLNGAFFTPQMCLAANLNNANGILLEGQTILFATFVSDNKIICSVTTSATEGSYSITLNNGLSATFNNVLLITLGTVIKPLASELTLSGQIKVDDAGNLTSLVYDTSGYATWTRELDWTKDWELHFSFKRSPLGSPTRVYYFDVLMFKNISNGVIKAGARMYSTGGTIWEFGRVNDGSANNTAIYTSPAAGNEAEAFDLYVDGTTFKVKYSVVAKTFTLFQGASQKYIWSAVATENVKITFGLLHYDMTDIKLVDL